MSAGAPWSVKGIDPKAREVAKDLARRSGLTLGEWLNRVILEDDTPEDVTNEAQFHDRPHRFSQDPPRLRAIPGGAQPDMARVAYALDRLTDRIEASETRTGLAISGVEHSVRQALARIEAAERGAAAVAIQQSTLSERVRELEAGPRSPEALRALEARLAEAQSVADPEGLLQRLGERIAEAETRTGGALYELQRALAALDGRLVQVERAGRGDPDRRFEALAEALTRQVEETRAELAARLAASSQGQVEARLEAMAATVQAAERRSAEAVEKMGREVLAMAEAVNRRLVTAERQGAQAIEQVGGEIARIAGAVEARLARAEHVQAEALERLGAEIGRITESLADRLASSERRAAEAIEAVGEQVARVTERIEQRHERAAGDLADQLRQSEARTARLLEQTRERTGAEALPAAAEEAAPRGPFGPELFSRAEPDLDRPPVQPERPPFAAEDFAAADGFAPIPEPEDDVFELDGEPAKETDERPLSTREVIEQARAAARAAAQAVPPPRPVEVRAKVDRRAASGRMFNGFGGAPRARRRGATPLQTALMVAGGAAFLSVGAAGVVLMDGPQAKPEEATAIVEPQAGPRAAVALAPAARPEADASRGGDAAFAEALQLVEAGRAGGLSKLKAVAEAGHPEAQFYLAQLYARGEAGVLENAAEARRWTALAAEGGEAEAMHNLGLYYFRGEGGPQDLASAAQWFRKAAAAGVVDSQYNLGLMYQSGSGVQQDLAEAYKWFALASAQGDGAAREGAEKLKPRIPPAAVRAADAAVAAAKAGA